MKQIDGGICISNGWAYGKSHVIKKKEKTIKKRTVDNLDLEVLRFHDGRRSVEKELRDLYQETINELDPENAQLFEAQITIINDPEFIKGTIDFIQREQCNAEFAVRQMEQHFVSLVSLLDDPYTRERTLDIRDVLGRLLTILNIQSRKEERLKEPAIIIAKELMPSELLHLGVSKILGVVLQQGTETSHTAILLKNNNIPTIVNPHLVVNLDDHGLPTILDGNHGILYIDPDKEVISKWENHTKKADATSVSLQKLIGEENRTIDGITVDLFANASSLEDVVLAKESDAGGIGLFRTEYLYLEKRTMPTEEEQLRLYREVAERMGDKRVVIRTFDLGDDKVLKLQHNRTTPILGYRGIRVSFDRPEIFRTQLRAIYRASVYGNLSIVFPMIVSLEEVAQIKNVISEVVKELEEEGISYREVALGIMIETPAAAMISDHLAKMVDFFCLGTNDLTQYTLGMDRLNLGIFSSYDPHHDSILRMIKLTIDNAHRNGVPVSICGDLASDPTITNKLLAMGVDELSVPPHEILPLRKRIREINLGLSS